MPIEVDATKAPAYLRWTVTGPWPSIDDLGAIRTRLIAGGQLTGETRVLIDMRNVETVPEYHEVPAMIQAALKAGGLPLRRAYVVASAVQFGLVRQMQALAPEEIKVEIFFNEGDALAWLHTTGEIGIARPEP
jgi:hypothetical protein